MTTADARSDEILERTIGCLVAGAVGDALGAGVEFLSWAEIRRQFGPDGVTGYVPAYGRLGAVTDDTQMTLFTAEGLIRAATRGVGRGARDELGIMREAYQRWLRTQTHSSPAPRDGDGWLLAVPELWSSRAPGNTCLSALKSGPAGRVGQREGTSKGCGGVMRVAPMGCLPAGERFECACAAAALTHTHPEGYLPAGALAVLVGALMDGDDLGTALDATERALATDPEGAPTFHALRAGRDLGAQGLPSAPAIDALGGGWVGEEALAIAAACAVAGTDDPVAAMLAAVNHSGDSDSTGAITGNILGAALGPGWIPQEWLAELELREVIEQIARDLDQATRHGVPADDDPGHLEWHRRYPRPRPRATPSRFTAEAEDFVITRVKDQVDPDEEH